MSQGSVSINNESENSNIRSRAESAPGIAAANKVGESDTDGKEEHVETNGLASAKRKAVAFLGKKVLHGFKG